MFVESERSHLPVLRANSALLVDCAVDVLGEDARAVPARLLARGDAFDLVFLDPPYRRGLADEILGALDAAPGLLAPGARIIAETSAHEVPREDVGGLRRDDGRRYGDTMLWLYRGPAAGA